MLGSVPSQSGGSSQHDRPLFLHSLCPNGISIIEWDLIRRACCFPIRRPQTVLQRPELSRAAIGHARLRKRLQCLRSGPFHRTPQFAIYLLLQLKFNGVVQRVLALVRSTTQHREHQQQDRHSAHGMEFNVFNKQPQKVPRY